MSQVIIITSNPDDEAIQHALKLLQGNGNYSVTVERPSPASLMAMALGMLSAGHLGDPIPDPALDMSQADLTVDVPIDADSDGAPDGETETDIEVSDDEFNFESIGMVDVDGELIEGFYNPKATQTVLYASKKAAGDFGRQTYSLNESAFGFFGKVVDGLAESVTPCSIVRNNKRLTYPVNISESTKGKPYVVIGSDGLPLI